MHFLNRFKSPETEAPSEAAALIVGLGNPGPEYEGTRHNAGFLLADRLAERWELGGFRRRGGAARVAEGNRAGVPVQVIKPQTYMNRSGAVLAPLRTEDGFDPARDLLVLVDDVALDVGRFRLRGAGSAGGHNGLKSVEGALGGLVGSVVGALIAKLTFFPMLTVADCVATALLLGMLGQLGDLFESLLKRSCGVKDSGTIVPGHGGILDRLDSILFAAPAAFYYAYFFFK